MLELVRALGLEDEVVSTLKENLGSFIVRDGMLHPIPKGLRLMAPSLWWPFLRSVC
jgi:protoporphyrinogen oxidase